MNYLIVTHAPHKQTDSRVYSYAPYVREMKLWNKNFDSVSVVTPVVTEPVSKIDLAYDKDVRVKKIPALGFTSWSTGLTSLLNIPIIFWVLFAEMRKADHIHLRCPGTIGLAGCIIQVLFPKKMKTAKYAGNWDPKSKQPLSYRLQKWLLSSTFWTKNMKVIVYGAWENQSKNVVPFFTASYRTTEIEDTAPRAYKVPFTFLFVGSLVTGKRPMYAITLIEQLINNGHQVKLTLFGDGIEREQLEQYVEEKELSNFIVFKGNQPAEIVKHAYQNSDFLVLPSKSEGWPKVLAEAMFWGAIPVSTKISCVPWMLDEGRRGVLLSLDLDKDVQSIKTLLQKGEVLEKMSKAGMEWSRQYTLDSFAEEIKKFV